MHAVTVVQEVVIFVVDSNSVVIFVQEGKVVSVHSVDVSVVGWVVGFGFPPPPFPPGPQSIKQGKSNPSPPGRLMPGGPHPNTQPGTSGSTPPNFGSGKPGGGPGGPDPPGQPGGRVGRVQMKPRAVWVVVCVVAVPFSVIVVALEAFVATQVSVKVLPAVVVSITPQGEDVGTFFAV